VKLACVVHRYGAEIAGGSEGHCRAIAERLAALHDVTVLTTCASDHVTWENVYPAGASRIGPVGVVRFAVARPRSMHRFADISELVFGGRASEAEQEQWFRENGPEAPGLLEHLERHGREFDRILFWSFRYYQTFFGLPLVEDRAVLLPTAEEDAAIRLGVVRRFFARPAGFVFLTPEEEALVSRWAAGPLAPACTIGTGLEPATAGAASGAAELAAAGIAPPYVLYLGRVDPNKGCETLLRYFVRRHEETGSDVPLVLAGPSNMPVPRHPAVTALGFVAEPVREALLRHAAALVVPSPYESLSLVLLEAWNHAVPALVNGRCGVLRGQALRSNGALYYGSYDEFARGLGALLDQPDLARQMGRQGLAYVDAMYRWPRVMATLDAFLNGL
jgi:glycosyltransferase involved in cell wall biosynthesis